MATLFITEYVDLARAGNGTPVMAGQEPARANQQVAVGVASAQSVALDDATKFVRLHADVPCLVAVDTDPDAATGMRLSAGQTEYLGVRGGLKVAVIESA